MDTSALLELETKSARVSATLDHRPEIAAVWRQCAGISEATSSLSLEDVPVTQSDLVNFVLNETVTSNDTQSIRVSEAVYRTILAPGHLLSHPDVTFDRAHRAGRLTSLVDVDQGGRASYPMVERDPEWARAKALFVAGAPRILRAGGPISLKAIAVAALLAKVSPERHPIAERIVLMAAESYLRYDLLLSDPITTIATPELSSAGYAHWIFNPSVALTFGTFRTWSPSTPTGQAELISSLVRSVNKEAGKLGEISSWLKMTKETYSSGRYKSKSITPADVLTEAPIITASTMSKRLDCSDRQARNLIAQAEEASIIAPIAQRNSYRVWAITPLHNNIKSRAMKRGRAQQSKRVPLVVEQEHHNIREAKASNFDDQLDGILAGLDDIMTATNKVLDKYVSRRTQASISQEDDADDEW